jgi:Cu/Ag efflux pump CusA
VAAAGQTGAILGHDVGTPVCAGMIAASAIGLFVIPMLYVTFQDFRARSEACFRRKHPSETMPS